MQAKVHLNITKDFYMTDKVIYTHIDKEECSMMCNTSYQLSVTQGK